MSADAPFDARSTSLPDGRGVELMLHGSQGLLSFADVQAGWREPRFADAFGARLAAEDHAASYWELPALRRGDLAEPFRCVLLDAPELTRMAPDGSTFGEHFAGGAPAVASFASLGGDAQLLAPAPEADPARHAHLQAFLRLTPRECQRALWSALADAWDAHLQTRPIWTSTSGLGVAWLHVRLDSRPKYYQHAPYTRAPAGG